MEELREQLANEMLIESKGAQICARVQWAEEGESSNAYFLRSEKVVGKRRLISQIKNKFGIIMKDTKDILNAWQEFYTDLFSSAPLVENKQKRFLDTLENSLSPLLSMQCEGPLTNDECFEAVSAMDSSKSPGIDGLPPEFFIKFTKYH